MKKLLAAIVMLIATAVSAQNITAVVAAPVSSGTDIWARVLLKKYDELHGTSSIVINKPGGDGAVGINYYNDLPNNIPKLLFPSTGHIVALPEHEFARWTALIEVSKQPFVLICRQNFPANNWKEFLEYARANPGKVNLGTGPRAAAWPLVDSIERRHGVKTNWIVYTGTSRGDMDVASGQLDCFFNTAGQTFNTGIHTRVKVFAVFGNDKIPGLDKSIVTGNVAGESYLHQGAFIHRDMDPEIRHKLHERFTSILRSDWAKEQFSKAGSRPGESVHDFNKIVNDMHNSWNRLKTQIANRSN